MFVHAAEETHENIIDTLANRCKIHLSLKGYGSREFKADMPQCLIGSSPANLTRKEQTLNRVERERTIGFSKLRNGSSTEAVPLRFSLGHLCKSRD
mmetsp:Transcript_10940/g.15776  ORF Transcript_10940/g.15776 Transcript_10940/m.15776 type:complete len:96 (+) Transcript_10940:1134-1421(+)